MIRLDPLLEIDEIQIIAGCRGVVADQAPIALALHREKRPPGRGERAFLMLFIEQAIVSRVFTQGVQLDLFGVGIVDIREPAVEKSLVGKAWDLDTVDQAIPNFRQDYTPLTDWRASSEYRQKVTENLFRRFYLESIGQHENLRLERKLTA